ncbi:MAG: PKD domain-containing protein [Anaerolineae bacterium]
MHRRGFILGLIAFVILGLVPLLTSSAISLRQLSNPLIVVSNEGQAGPNVDKTLIQDTITDPAPNWRSRFFNPVGWQNAYPVMRAPAWTTSSAVAPLLDDGADHIWGGTPGAFSTDDGNGMAYPNRFDGSDYDNGYAIPTSPSPQYLFLRKDFCLPINAQANPLRRLTVGDISISLLNATDSTAVPDGAASVWLNNSTIATGVPGDESGSTTLIDIPDPTFLYRGRNTLAMRAGDARSDERAAILYRAAFSYAIDPNAIIIGVNTTIPFEQQVVQFNATTDGLSGRSPYNYSWTFGDGSVGTGSNVNHTYLATGTYTVGLTITDTESCTGTAEIPITVLPFPLAIAKTAQPAPVTAGETLRYQITVQNNSTVRALTNVVVTDILPTGTTFSFCTGGCIPPTPPNRTVQWILGSLASEASSILDLYVTVALTTSGTLTNTTYGVQTNEVTTTGVPIAVEVLPPPCLKSLTGVDVTGPISGLIGNLTPFTGTIAPPDATAPVYYTWTPTPTSGQGMPNASYQWTTPGTYTLTLRAANCGGAVTATHVISVSSPCPRPLTNVSIAGPTSGFTDTPYAFTSAITPANATGPVTYTWSPSPTISGQSTPTATYQWITPGLYTLTLTVENCGGVFSTTHAISVSAPPITCPRPLTDVSIAGPTSGFTDTSYAFTSAITPTDTTAPVTYTWSPPPLSGQSTPTATYQWITPGLYTLTLTVENCGGVFSTTHAISVSAPPITCQRPLTDVSIAGSTSGFTNTLYNFFGVVNPADATQPVTYTWSPPPINGQSTPTATYQWTATGSYTITLTVENCGGVFGVAHVIAIQVRQPSFVYLPLILRNYPDDAPDDCPGWSLAIGVPFDEDLDHASDDDWFTFQATIGTSYTIRTQDLQIRADTVITLYNSTCTIPLIGNDDLPYPSSSRASQVEWRADVTGDLHVLVRSYEPSFFGPDTGYSLVVYDDDNPPPPIDDAPDFCAAATPLPIGQPYTDDFDHANDNDWFVFDVTAGRTYTITTSNLAAQANTALDLWDGNCLTKLATNDPATPDAQIVRLAATSGQLRVNVRHHDWTIYGPDTGYTVTIEEE